MFWIFLVAVGLTLLSAGGLLTFTITKIGGDPKKRLIFITVFSIVVGVIVLIVGGTLKCIWSLLTGG